MYYFFLIVIIILLCYIYNYNTILTLISIIHVFISLILSYTLYDQVVLFNWIYKHFNDDTIIENTNSNFKLSSYTKCYWTINGLLLLFIVYILITNNFKYLKK